MREGPKHVHADIGGVRGYPLLKVLSQQQAAHASYPPDSVLLWDEASQSGACGQVTVSNLREHGVIRSGDVIRLREGGSMVSLLYRRGSRSNTLFTTEQCNSACLMCSQPPRDHDDSWLGRELLDLIPLIDPDEPALTVTGGEPTLLSDRLGEILTLCGQQLPNTRLQVLTNGRSLSNPALAERLVASGGSRTTWAVPVYADGAPRHDEIMGAPGSFDETMEGLAELARLGARVEIRVVLHRLSAPRLPQLASFIYRRLPFVEHVALMGLEPIGYAKLNRDRLWIDPADYVDALAGAVFHLANRGVPVSVYNLPLCLLPADLHPFARQSISDWKNSFPPVCSPARGSPNALAFLPRRARPGRAA